MSALIALIFLFTTITPSWAVREGNYGETTSIEAFGAGFLSGAVTDIFIMLGGGCTGSYAAGIGSIASNLVSVYMYYNHYDTYGESVMSFKVFGTEVTISRGQFWSMVAGVIASVVTGVVAGALGAGAKCAVKGAAEGVGQSVAKTTVETVAKEGTQQAIDNAVKDIVDEALREKIRKILEEMLKKLEEAATQEATRGIIDAAVKEVAGAIAEALEQAMVSAIESLGRGATKELINSAIQDAIKSVLGETLYKSISEEALKQFTESLVNTLCTFMVEEMNKTFADRAWEATFKLLTDLPTGTARLAVSRTIEEVLVEKYGWDRTYARIAGGLGAVVIGMGVAVVAARVAADVVWALSGRRLYVTNKGQVINEKQKQLLDDVAKAESLRSLVEGKTITFKDPETGETKTGELKANKKDKSFYVMTEGVKISLDKLEPVGEASAKALNAAKDYADIAFVADGLIREYGDMPRSTKGLNLQDPKAMSSSEAFIEAIRSLGLKPLVSTATQIIILNMLDYETYRGKDKKKIYNNTVKMAVARGGSAIAGEMVANWNDAGSWYAGTSNNPWETKGDLDYWRYIATTAAKEAAGTAAESGFAYLNKKWDLNTSSGISGLVHAGVASVAGGAVDAAFRRDPGEAQEKQSREIVVYEKKDPDTGKKEIAAYQKIGNDDYYTELDKDSINNPSQVVGITPDNEGLELLHPKGEGWERKEVTAAFYNEEKGKIVYYYKTPEGKTRPINGYGPGYQPTAAGLAMMHSPDKGWKDLSSEVVTQDVSKELRGDDFPLYVDGKKVDRAFYNEKTGETVYYQKREGKTHWTAINKYGPSFQPTDKGLALQHKTEEGWIELSRGDPIYNGRLGLNTESVGRFARGVAEDFNNTFVQAAADTVLLPYPYRSTGVGPGAYSAYLSNQDKWTERMESAAQGVSPMQAQATAMGQNLTAHAASQIGNSVGYAIANNWLPPEHKQYATFIPTYINIEIEKDRKEQELRIKEQAIKEAEELNNKLQGYREKKEKEGSVSSDASKHKIIEHEGQYYRVGDRAFTNLEEAKAYTDVAWKKYVEKYNAEHPNSGSVVDTSLANAVWDLEGKYYEVNGTLFDKRQDAEKFLSQSASSQPAKEAKPEQDLALTVNRSAFSAIEKVSGVYKIIEREGQYYRVGDRAFTNLEEAKAYTHVAEKKYREKYNAEHPNSGSVVDTSLANAVWDLEGKYYEVNGTLFDKRQDAEKFLSQSASSHKISGTKSQVSETIIRCLPAAINLMKLEAGKLRSEIQAGEDAIGVLKYGQPIPIVGAALQVGALAPTGVLEKGYVDLPDVVKGGIVDYSVDRTIVSSLPMSEHLKEKVIPSVIDGAKIDSAEGKDRLKTGVKEASQNYQLTSRYNPSVAGVPQPSVTWQHELLTNTIDPTLSGIRQRIADNMLVVPEASEESISRAKKLAIEWQETTKGIEDDKEIARKQSEFINKEFGSGIIESIEKEEKGDELSEEEKRDLTTFKIMKILALRANTPHIEEVSYIVSLDRPEKKEKVETALREIDEGRALYSTKYDLASRTTRDRFGRNIETTDYAQEYNARTGQWETVKQDKSTRHYYGPFGPTVSVTKDYTYVELPNTWPSEKKTITEKPAWDEPVIEPAWDEPVIEPAWDEEREVEVKGKTKEEKLKLSHVAYPSIDSSSKPLSDGTFSGGKGGGFGGGGVGGSWDYEPVEKEKKIERKPEKEIEIIHHPERIIGTIHHPQTTIDTIHHDAIKKEIEIPNPISVGHNTYYDATLYGGEGMSPYGSPTGRLRAADINSGPALKTPLPYSTISASGQISQKVNTVYVDLLANRTFGTESTVDTAGLSELEIEKIKVEVDALKPDEIKEGFEQYAMERFADVINADEPVSKEEKAKLVREKEVLREVLGLEAKDTGAKEQLFKQWVYTEYADKSPLVDNIVKEKTARIDAHLKGDPARVVRADAYQYDELRGKDVALPVWSAETGYSLDKDLKEAPKFNENYTYTYSLEEISSALKAAKKKAKADGNKVYSDLLDDVKVTDVDDRYLVDKGTFDQQFRALSRWTSRAVLPQEDSDNKLSLPDLDRRGIGAEPVGYKTDIIDR